MKMAVIKSAVVTFALAILGVSWLFSRHVLWTSRGWIIVPKQYLCWSGTWSDARRWTWEDYSARPRIVEALNSAGYGAYLKELQRDSRRALWRARRDALLGKISVGYHALTSHLPWNRGKDGES